MSTVDQDFVFNLSLCASDPLVSIPLAEIGLMDQNADVNKRQT